MAKILFLVDLDLTLIDKDYRPTISPDRIAAKASQLEADGHIFGLMSDSAFETLSGWMTTFGFHGPVISEKGALIVFPTGDQITTVQECVDWLRFTATVRQALQSIFPSSFIVKDDYRKFISVSGNVPPTSDVVFIINPYRKHSFGMHVRQVDIHGNKVIEPELFQKVAASLVESLGKTFDLTQLTIDANPMYCVMIVHENQVCKSAAIPLLRAAYPEHQIVMIGDGETDAELKGAVNNLWAVGNATQSLKDIADRVAHNTITSGVLELLEHWKA